MRNVLRQCSAAPPACVTLQAPLSTNVPNALMGACSSCLNPDRHKSTQPGRDEEEALLDDHGHSQYGSVSAGDGALATAAERARARARESEPAPETLRREREEMERIWYHKVTDLQQGDTVEKILKHVLGLTRKQISRVRLVNFKLPSSLVNKLWLFTGKFAIVEERRVHWEFWEKLTDY